MGAWTGNSRLLQPKQNGTEVSPKRKFGLLWIILGFIAAGLLSAYVTEWSPTAQACKAMGGQYDLGMTCYRIERTPIVLEKN